MSEIRSKLVGYITNHASSIRCSHFALTTAIETVPASGTLPAYAQVNGVVAAAGSTFQTGDIVNGTANANNKVIITDAGALGANVVASVNNVAEIKHNLLANNTYDESLYSGVAEEYSSNASVAGNTLTLLNGQLATTYGVKDSAANASTLNVGIRAADTTGTANTLKLSVRNAGSTIVQTGVAPVANVATINSTSTGIEAIALVTSGVNNIAITDNPAVGVVTDYAKLTVTGDGANTIDVSALTQNLNYDLSGSTGANTLQFAAALQSNTVVVGGSAADSVRVNQGTVVAGISLTGVETLRSSVGGATGTIAFTTSSLNTIRVDGDNAEGGVLTLIAPGSVATINYIGDGLAANVNAQEQFKGLTITGAYNGTADAVAITLSNAGTTNLNGYGVGAITANGVETVAITVTQADVAATAAFAGITSNTLQSVTFTSPSAVTATIDATPVAGNSALTSVNLSAVTGTVGSTITLANGAVGAATQVIGSTGTGGTTLNTNVQAAGDIVLFTGGQGNDTINAFVVGGNAFAGILQASMGAGTNAVNVGDQAAGGTASTSIITLSGTGSVNTITGGSAADTITVTANGLGSTNVVIGAAGDDVINAAASTVAITLNGGAGADVITGGSGVDTYGQASNFSVQGQSVASTANTLTAGGIVATNTVTFGNGVDRVTNFVSGVDKLDVATAATAPTTLIGVTTGAALTNNTTYVLYGSYNTATNLFTAAAAYGAGTTDAVVVTGNGAATAVNTTGIVVLTGLNQALVAADFI